MTAPAGAAAPVNGKPAKPVPEPPSAEELPVPAEVVQELLDVALGSTEGQRIWRLWCRLTPAVQALGQLRVRVNPGVLTVSRAPVPEPG